MKTISYEINFDLKLYIFATRLLNVLLPHIKCSQESPLNVTDYFGFINTEFFTHKILPTSIHTNIQLVLEEGSRNTVMLKPFPL